MVELNGIECLAQGHFGNFVKRHQSQQDYFPPIHPSIHPQHKHVSYTSVGVTHISSPNPSPPPQVIGIHASGSVQCIMGHWHVALSASDPLSLIADKHGVQKAQKSCVMSGVTYIRGLLLVAAASRGRPLDTVAAALVV